MTYCFSDARHQKLINKIHLNEHVYDKMNDITADYIRGFFDGEGCVYVKQRHLVIVNTNLSLLQRIKRKLASLRIESHLGVHSKTKRRRPSEIKRRRICYRLRIFGYHNILRLSKLIGSPVKEKRQALADIMGSFKRIPLTEDQKQQIRRLRKEGLTYSKIARMFNKPLSSVFLICNKT